MTFGQTGSLWTQTARRAQSEVLGNKVLIQAPKLFQLNIDGLKSALKNAPKKLAADEKSGKIITFPSSEGIMEDFKVAEHSNFEPTLEAKYPDIKSYVGQSLADPSKVFS